MTRKRSSGKAGGASGRRGGRKPGAWTHTTPQALRRFRAENRLSRGRLAAMLGVSATSVQNWEAGKVASEKIQVRLAEVIDKGIGHLADLPALPGKARNGGGLLGSPDPVITTTGAIVAGYLNTRASSPVTPEELVGLIRVVRIALS